MIKSELSRNEYDTVKGILIICIVLGHTLVANTLIPSLKTILYSFHVFCFLFFPFLFSAKPFTVNNIKDLFVRYMVPYLISVTLCSVVYNIIILSNFNIILWSKNLLKALITGNDLYLQKACGFGLYWFLPVLLVLNIFKSLYYHQKPLAKYIILGFFYLGHFLIGALPWRYKQYFPLFGIHIVIYILPLGILCGYLFRKYFFILFKLRLFILLLFVSIVTIMIYIGSAVNISHLGVYSYKNPLLLILHDLIPIFAFFIFLSFSDILVKVPYLSFIGKNSLLIYITHQIFIFGFESTVSKIGLPEINTVLMYTTGVLSLFSGICFPLILLYLLNIKQNLKRIILPRNKKEFFVGFQNYFKRLRFNSSLL